MSSMWSTLKVFKYNSYGHFQSRIRRDGIAFWRVIRYTIRSETYFCDIRYLCRYVKSLWTIDFDKYMDHPIDKFPWNRHALGTLQWKHLNETQQCGKDGQPADTIIQSIWSANCYFIVICHMYPMLWLLWIAINGSSSKLSPLITIFDDGTFELNKITFHSFIHSYSVITTE